MQLAVIIPAAGSSTRYAKAFSAQHGSDLARSKLDEDLGGRPVLQRTVELFTNLPETVAIIVAGPHDPKAMAAFRDRHGDKLGLLGAKVCPGGATHRWETVRNALALVPDKATHVAVHDAARPCASVELIRRVLDAAIDHPAVIPGIDVPDTLKSVDDTARPPVKADPLAAILGPDPHAAGTDAGAGGSGGGGGVGGGSGGGAGANALRYAKATVPRAGLVAVQTPQVFAAGLLRRAYAQPNLDSTDDAQLIERLNDPSARVVIVPGEPRNLKITWPADLDLARAILNVKPPAERPAHLRF